MEQIGKFFKVVWQWTKISFLMLIAAIVLVCIFLIDIFKPKKKNENLDYDEF